MDKTKIISNLQGVAEYLKATKIPVGELEAIKRILGCVSTLENLVEELKNDETDNQ